MKLSIVIISQVVFLLWPQKNICEGIAVYPSCDQVDNFHLATQGCSTAVLSCGTHRFSTRRLSDQSALIYTDQNCTGTFRLGKIGSCLRVDDECAFGVEAFSNAFPIAHRLDNLKSCKLPSPILFVHLAKCAGTSLTGSMRSATSATLPFIQLWSTPSYEMVQKYQLGSLRPPFLIGGHLAYGFHKWLITSPESNQLFQENMNFTYITMLRDPIERVWSHYNYHLTQIRDENHIFAKNKSLNEWMSTVEFGRNAMTAYLSGAVADSWWNENSSIPMLSARPQPINISHPNPKYDVTEEHFQLALKNLRRMGWVGIQERYDESISQLSLLLGVQLDHTQENLASKKIQLDQDRVLIESYNAFDIKLYAVALEMFQEQTHLLSEYCNVL